MVINHGWVKLIVIGIALYLLSKVTSVFLPIILAVVLAFVLNPLVNFFCRPFGKYRLPRPVAVLLSFIFTIGIFTALGTFILIPLVSEFNKFLANLPALVQKMENLSVVIGQSTSIAYLPQNIQSLVDQILSIAASFFMDLAGKVVNGIFSFATQIIELVVVPVLVYYFLTDWLVLKEGVVSIFPNNVQSKAAVIIQEMGRVISSYIRGQVVISLIIGAIVAVGMYFLGVDYPLVLGLIATLTETIPIVGPIIGSMPAIFLAYLVSPILAVKTAVFYIVIHQLENHIIVPNIMGHTIALHPVVIIISLLIGGQLLGIVGMILAVPVAALLRVLFKYLW